MMPFFQHLFYQNLHFSSFHLEITCQSKPMYIEEMEKKNMINMSNQVFIQSKPFQAYRQKGYWTQSTNAMCNAQQN